MASKGACHSSRAFKAALGDGVKHWCTGPCGPQANGKVERLNRTLAAEWDYAEVCLSGAARAAT